jgi:glycosyltransferase involved in cell wall biosynthesis
MKHRLAILSTHPIQYNAPLFRLLAAEDDIVLKVFYSKQVEEVRFDPDFGQEVVWDIPLTDGYDHESFAASDGAGCHQMFRAIEGFKPDALLVYGWNFPGHLKAMRHFHGKVPVWFRGDSTLIDPLPLWKKWLRKVWLRWVYRHVDKAFYVGSANKQYFLWTGLTEEQLVYAPHAVDNDFFSRDDENRRRQAREIRSQLGISEDAFVFLFVGKLEAIKQPLELARAFRAMLATSKETIAHLIFVGTGVLSNQLKTENLACEKVHFVGFVNQSMMPVYYRLGDCLCLMSISETWGLAVNEFLASAGGALILSDRVGCAEDLVHCGKGGIVVSCKDMSLLQNTMKKVVNSRGRFDGRQDFNGHFSMKKVAQTIHSQLN